MFTGIVESTGVIREATMHGSACRLQIFAPDMHLEQSGIGDSIAVDGVCLTVTDLTADYFYADVSDETLRCTTLGQLRAGSKVNLEKAVTPSTPLGGHLVTGHVDGVGQILSRSPAGGSERWRCRVPEGLEKYIAAKGSIAIAGVSLTINYVEGCDFELNLIPHTLAATNLGDLSSGDPVNIEVDLIARYVERLLSCQAAASQSGLTMDDLRRAGFGDV
ncbi:riboflavin synthase [Halorhodospira halochloris]|uniref:riboflavin synthase n=1 Tax=Halorhodospira halochloris TaxID=1052 RepID=UPI001EE97B0C|nr:riboflavin synthase [Halorhodospira halochloris]MCG5529509.1 riboflavin synthase [Halorhodospira halochloris]